jgi:hypothetical protein
MTDHRDVGGDDLDRDDLDPDASWVTESGDDEFVATIPPSVEPLVTRRLAAGAAVWSPNLSIEIDEPDGRRALDEAEMTGLIDDASRTCSELIGRPMAPEQLLVLTQAASILATVWSMSLAENEADAAADTAERAWVDAVGKLAADCETMLFARIRPRSDGTFSLHWRAADRAVIADATAELRGVLSSDDPAVSRLFPSAYGSDGERNAGWDVLMRGELIERRLQALEVVADLMGRDRCDAEELGAFMRAVNDARLVLGTRLDVDESGVPGDLDPADRASYAEYEHLGFLLALTIRALRGTL